ncbi:zf-HC2 domain-containing protein [Promicromonospora citrea]|uniref:zf-HC2 domain-containing protein n=1 Tax=Promicromonospora citrea TaxID=43677 RepID=UPI001667B84D|nr:sigma-70 family RNA polymerase sigma factor [Promicromonospora citrea]
MTTTGDLRIDDWVVHRRNVVRSVAARVPGVDAEEAASRALEKMIRIVSTGGTIDDPAPYWRRAAVNEAISMTREAGRATTVEDDTLDGLAPPVEGAELDAERQADVSMLRTALADLAEDDRRLLLDRHVHDKAVTDIADGLGVRPHAVTMRLRRAEERLAGAFAAAHARAVNEPECRTTRAGMHDYLKGRMLPRRQRRLEVHMDSCADCTRAFMDVREVSWMLRELGQHVVAALVVTGSAGGTGGAGGATVGKKRRDPDKKPGPKELAAVAGVLLVLGLGGVAAAMVASQDRPPAEAGQAVDGGGAGAGGGAGGSGGAAAAPPTEEADSSDEPDTAPEVPPAGSPPPQAAPPSGGGAPTTGSAVPAPVDAEPEPATRPAPGPDGEDEAPEPGRPAPGGDADPGSDEPPVVAEPEVPEPPQTPEPPAPTPPSEPEEPAPPQTPGVGTALTGLLASLGLSGLPGIDLVGMTLDQLWALLFGTVTPPPTVQPPAGG